MSKGAVIILLKDILDIRLNDVITIVGAGGKTSLMGLLAEELKCSYRVLMTTTTKIYKPTFIAYNNNIMLTKNIKNYSSLNIDKNGIYVIGKYVNNEGKLVGLDFEELDNVIDKFDIVIIEGDGSKRKPLKGWNDDEPIVHPLTTKTIGVVNIQSVGLSVDDNNIHRLNRFIDITNTHYGAFVNVGILSNMIFNRNGLFKNSVGDRILFVNKVESVKNKIDAKNLVEYIKLLNKKYLDGVVCGSLIKNKYFKG